MTPDRLPGPAEREELRQVWNELNSDQQDAVLYFLNWLVKEAGMLTEDERREIVEGVLRGE